MFEIILVSFLLFTKNIYCDTPTLRMTTNGPVEGIEQISILGQKFYSFRGVPFAAPPITGIDPYTGKFVDRRFKAPKPLEIFRKEPLKAHNFSKACMQNPPTNGIIYDTSEDCLYLNIYIPAGGAVRKTVMVFIHGGRYASGSGDDKIFGPDFLLAQDNILVTIQYRLGIFGFLNLDCGDYTGNMGLKDQQIALKWIHTNIPYFSGRNDQILLFGQSAGAVSVQLQMLNPESRRYFNRAFALSGSGLGAYAIWKTSQLEQIRECSKIYQKAKLIEYLKTENSTVLLQCQALKANRFRSIWIPTIENPRVVGAFMTKMPEETYKSNEAPAMDTMLSMTSQELLGLDPYLYNLTDPKEMFEEDWMLSSTQIPCKGSGIKAFPKGFEQEMDLLTSAYFTNLSNPDVVRQENIFFVSDLNVGYTVVKGAVLQTNANHNGACLNDRKNVFLFRFDVHSTLNAVELVTKMVYKGATHGDDLCYLFCCNLFNPYKIYDNVLKNKDLSYDIIVRSVKMITNFARTGNPSIDSNTYLVPTNKLSNKICCGVISNSFTPRVIDMRKVMHYDIWVQTENIFNGFNCVTTYRNQICHLEKIIRDLFS